MKIEINCSPYCSGWSLVACPVVSGSLVDPGTLPHRTEHFHMFFPCSGRKPGNFKPPLPNHDAFMVEVGAMKRGNSQLHVIIIITPNFINSPPANSNNEHQVKPKSLSYYRCPCPYAMQRGLTTPAKSNPAQTSTPLVPVSLSFWLAPLFFLHPFSLFSCFPTPIHILRAPLYPSLYQ